MITCVRELHDGETMCKRRGRRDRRQGVSPAACAAVPRKGAAMASEGQSGGGRAERGKQASKRAETCKQAPGVVTTTTGGRRACRAAQSPDPLPPIDSSIGRSVGGPLVPTLRHYKRRAGATSALLHQPTSQPEHAVRRDGCPGGPRMPAAPRRRCCWLGVARLNRQTDRARESPQTPHLCACKDRATAQRGSGQ